MALYRSVWLEELSRSIAIELNLPGVRHNEIRVRTKGRNLYVRAWNARVAYEWAKELDGTIQVSLSVLPDNQTLNRLAGTRRAWIRGRKT